MRSDKIRKNIYISKAAWDRLAAAVGKRGVSQAIEDAAIEAAAVAEKRAEQRNDLLSYRCSWTVQTTDEKNETED